MNSKKPAIDHVNRLIESHFDVVDHELQLDGQSISSLADTFGTPFFVYDQRVIQDKIARLRSLLPDNFKLFYSIKANPNAQILRLFLQQNCGLEVASEGELAQAIHAGCSADQIIFAGPGKTDRELAAAIDAQIHEVHVESLEEAVRMHKIAEQKRKTASIALRVNPVDTSGGAMQMGGRPSPFGIDEEQLDDVVRQIKELSHLKIQGVHLFMGTQILDAQILISQYQRGIEIAARVAQLCGEPLKTIDFGGGLGTPYFAHESPLDLELLGSGLRTVRDQMAAEPNLQDATAILEPGRFLVGESGIYVAKVIRTKHSRGKQFAVIDGGMHHHLAASGNLGQTIKRNFPIAVLNKIDHAPTESVEIVGPLCTPLDTLGRGISLPPIEAGDLIGVFASGAYARTSSPLGFLSHPSVPEVLIEDGKPRLIRRRGLPADFHVDQVQ